MYFCSLMSNKTSPLLCLETNSKASKDFEYSNLHGCYSPGGPKLLYATNPGLPLSGVEPQDPPTATSAQPSPATQRPASRTAEKPKIFLKDILRIAKYNQFKVEKRLYQARQF
jgi:hypothetical protein